MSNIEALKCAILERRPICYDYHTESHTRGLRMGNPHIIYLTSKQRIETVQIYKTGGVETPKLKSKPLPDWRTYRIENVKVLSIEDSNFEIADSFNPYSPMYVYTICSVSRRL